MTQPTPDEFEWTTWIGGERPVKGYEEVEIKRRDQRINIGLAYAFFWGRLRNESRHDIIAYRVVTP